MQTLKSQVRFLIKPNLLAFFFREISAVIAVVEKKFVFLQHIVICGEKLVFDIDFFD